MDNFPPLPAPAIGEVACLEVGAFIEALHGRAAAGGLRGGDLAAVQPQLLALDVRSPAEYVRGCIPGAVSLPLLSDEEQAAVAATYQRRSTYAAIREALLCLVPKFSQLFRLMDKHNAAPGDHVLVYCWRGGMRSGSVAWLLSLCGFRVSMLEGGYRSYRRWCASVLDDEQSAALAPIMVLGGHTGVGKTAVLKQLREGGEQFLDLEGLANHRGSAFGSMGQAPQPTNEAYENVLALAIRQVDPSRRLWLEHEGQHVGKCAVPKAIQAWVQRAPGGLMVVLQMSQELRVQRLVEDYCSAEKVQEESWVCALKECISGGLGKKLGTDGVREAHQLLEEGKWEAVALLMLEYYDKLYQRWESQSDSSRVKYVKCPTADASDNAGRVLRALAEEMDEGAVPASVSGMGSAPAGTASDEAPERENATVLPDFTGHCHCGEVRMAVVGKPRSVSYCHCSICRRLSGAPFSCQALFSPEQVQTTLEVGAKLSSLQTSKGVERLRCASCLSPVHAKLFGGKMIAVPLGLLGSWRRDAASIQLDSVDTEQEQGNQFASLRPQHHLHYSDRVMDIDDDLPKYEGPVRTAANSKGGAKAKKRAAAVGLSEVASA